MAKYIKTEEGYKNINSAGMQSDWNQNDSTSLSYIKNRPFYTSDPQEVTVVEETTPIDSSVSLTKGLEEGKEYIVTFNDVAYSCVAKNYGGYLMIGNNAIYEYDNDDMTDTGEPFAIESFASGGAGPLSDEEAVTFSGYIYVAEGIDITTAKISITTIEATDYKIDKKYLPEIEFPEPLEGAYVGKKTAEEGEIFNLASAAALWAHAEGNNTTASGLNSHAEGKRTTASGENSHAEGYYTVASGEGAHAEGNYVKRSGLNYYSTASGKGSHAEGIGTTASGDGSHAEGYISQATGNSSHAEGWMSQATGHSSHAEGNSQAIGDSSHAEGHSYAASSNQHTQGKFNIIDSSDKYAHIVGNGVSDSDDLRSNAHTLDWNGIGWFQGGLQVGGNAQDDGAKNVMLEGNAYDYFILNDASTGTPYKIQIIDGNLVSSAMTSETESTT